MHTFKSNLIKTDVTTVGLFKDFVLAGIGNYLHIYDSKTGTLIKKIRVFDEQIFGIEFNVHNNELLLFGTNKLRKAQIVEPLDVIDLKPLDCEDWILTAKFIDSSSTVVTISMHNVVEFWSTDLVALMKVECVERCISYCAHVVCPNESSDEVIVLSGTVFSQILIWRPAEAADGFCPVLCRLEGHKGVVFSIDYSLKLGLICSTSDDRTAILWAVKNKDLSRALNEPDVKITRKCTLYGHSARVFKCKFSEDHVITGGEDCLVNIWSADGDLIRRIDTHQGGCVRALDCDKNNNLVTGGEDCGVSLFALNILVNTNRVKLETSRTPKRVVVLSSNNLVIITEDGTLFHFNSSKDALREIHKHDDLKSYALLEKSNCGNFVAVAGFHGNMHVYKDLGVDLQYRYSCQIKNKGRIFALHWLSCKMILTCGPDGVLTLWAVKSYLAPIHFLRLPPSKERWTTSACLCGSEHVLVGDRRGNLYLYSLYLCDPVQVFKKAHNYLGITAIYREGNKVISLGRNSVLNEYQFHPEAKKLTLTSSDKVPFTWLARLHQETHLLLGFSGNSLTLWDYNSRRTLLERNCGGGHRSWDSSVNKKSFYFACIKDKTVNVLSCDTRTLRPTNIVEGYHVKEINALKCVKLGDRSKYVLISGGEDTTLRVSLLDLNELDSFIKLNVLKSHLSSIRTITTCKIEEFKKIETKHTENEIHSKYFVFSAGGRAQILMWELTMKVKKNSTSKIICSERHSYYEAPNREESETRIMDLCSFVLDRSVILFAACSDGCVKHFTVSIDDDSNELCYVDSFAYKLKCILKISRLKVGDTNVLVTMATDGYITFWDVSSVVREAELGTQNLQPVCAVKAHQSGINTYSFRQVKESDYLFLTGGDDNAIVLNLIRFSNFQGGLCVETLASYSDVGSHCAQITGSFITGEYFITSSVDQKVLLFSWCLQGDAIEVGALSKYVSTVCDIQGLECLSSGEKFRIVVFGRGLEVLTINKSDS